MLHVTGTEEETWEEFTGTILPEDGRVIYVCVIFNLLRTCIIKFYQHKNYIFCQLMRHYDVTDSQQCLQTRPSNVDIGSFVT